MTNRKLTDIRDNTINDCFNCIKDSKNCKVCVWRK